MSKFLHSILVLFALEKNKVSMMHGMLEAIYSTFYMYYLRKSVFSTLQSEYGGLLHCLICERRPSQCWGCTSFWSGPCFC